MNPLQSNLHSIFGHELAEKMHEEAYLNPMKFNVRMKGNGVHSFIQNIESLRFCNKPDEVARVVAHHIIAMSQNVDSMMNQLMESKNLEVAGKIHMIEKKPQWVSVDDEMPEEEGVYLCHFSDGTIETYDLWNVYGISFQFAPVTIKGEEVRVIHWMPLPEKPK